MKYLLVLLIVCLFGGLFGDEDVLGMVGRLDITPTIIQPELSAKRAMIMSAVVPGAGQFYINRRSLTAYLFPVIEIGLLYMLFDQRNKGDKATRDFEAFADEHYNEEQQWWVQWDLMDRYWLPNGDPNPNYFYSAPNRFRPGDEGFAWGTARQGESGHFRLDRSDKQHYFEDIGKYDKYVFGWNDWFSNYVRGTDTGVEINWVWNDREFLNDARVIGVRPFDSDENDGWQSALRDEYRDMRRTANNHYATSRTMSYLLMVNHAVSAIDANRMARKNNNEVRRQTFSSITPTIRTNFANRKPTTMIGLNMNF